MTPGALKAWRLGPISLLWHPRSLWLCLGLGALAVALAGLLLGTGTLPLGFGRILSALHDPAQDPLAGRILLHVRLPRVLTAAGVGAALGMAGAAFQALTRNPLGSPDVVGFTTGAATGAIALLVLGGGSGLAAAPLGTALAAVISGGVSALAVLLLAYRAGAVGSYRLVLVGIGVGATLNGLNTLLLAKGALERVMSAQLWLAGSLNGRNWDHVAIALSGLLIAAPVLLVLSRRLALLEMGEDMARQLGLGIGATRVLSVLAAITLTSLATAAAGPIAFIALATPQIARRLTRAPELPILPSALVGVVLMLGADWISQRANFGLVLPIGLVTGCLGGAYLLLVLARTGRKG